MPDAPPLHLLLLARPEAPGAAALLDRARAEHARGRRLTVLLTGAGLAWIEVEALERLAAEPGVAVGLCSRSARDRGIRPERLPDGIRWTSLVAWFTALPTDAELWSALP